MLWNGMGWRLLLAVVIVLLLWWIVPAVLALVVIIAPPVAPAVGPFSLIIRGLLAIWGVIYVATGKGGPVIP
jgi:hypothetical protein